MDWKKNRVIIGAVVLVVLVGVTVWAFESRRQETVEATADEGAVASLPEIDEAEVTSLEVRRPEEEPIRLERRDDGWWVVAPLEAIADQSVVNTALDKLAGLEVRRVAARKAENHERLEVDEAHGVRVIAKAGEETLADFYIGSYGGGSTMVRPEGQDEVLAVAGSIKFAFNKALKDWRNRRVVDVSPADVTRVAFENADGTWRFERNAEDEWTLSEGQEEIERFGPAKVQSAVASLARMRAVDFAAPDVTAEQAGLGEGAAVVRLTVRRRPAGEDEEAEGEADGNEGGEAEPEQAEEAEATPVQTEEIVLRLGGESEDGQFYLQREGDDTIFLVSTFLANKVRSNAESFQLPEEKGESQESEEEDDGAEGATDPPGAQDEGGPGKIPPEVMRQIRQQLEQQGQAGH